MNNNFLIFINKFFPLPKHPLNMQNNGEMTYAMWQYKKGIETIKFYLKHYSEDEIFKNKKVLDIGCGAGGKSLYYLTLGAESVTGIDIVEKYKEESDELQKSLGLEGFNFLVCDASDTVFPDNTFDTIIMNDAMEHVNKPEKVLNEIKRILKPGGKLYVNFPPYNHPFGAHLSDAIGIPWVHLFFSDDTLIKSYKELVKKYPDGDERIKFRISTDENGKEYFSYINKMTIKRFNKLIKECGLIVDCYDEVPLRKIFKPLTFLPSIKDCFVKMVVCILEKGE